MWTASNAATYFHYISFLLLSPPPPIMKKKPVKYNSNENTQSIENEQNGKVDSLKRARNNTTILTTFL